MDERELNKLEEQAIKLAKELQLPQQNTKTTVFEKRIGPLLETPEAKTFMIRLMDTSFRSENSKRIAAYVYKIIIENSASSKIFNLFEKQLIALFKLIGRHVPGLSIPLMLQQIKSVTRSILFFTGSKTFEKQAENRRREGVQLNVNLIGEALIGEAEAAERIEKYCQLLAAANINYISIKASTIYSQIKPVAFEYTVGVLAQKLSIIYDKVLEIEADTGEQKFVNLDMEEYRDLEITLAVFMKTLDIPKYKKLRAGIVLQAYLPDTYNAMQQLQQWALKRTENGGSPVKVRLVKGANLEMEKTEASLENWSLATYDNKLKVDANYKRILLELLNPDKVKSLHVGIASHNLFDLSFGLNLVKKNQLENLVDFEMLEGMANATVKTLISKNVNVLLYTPIVAPENYNSAIAYLVRRLDEGTQNENFLKEGYQLKVNDAKWQELQDSFSKSIAEITNLKLDKHRKQNRNTDKYIIQKTFQNSANTDWCIPENRNWIKKSMKIWKQPLQILGDNIPVEPQITTDYKKVHLEYWQGKTPWKYELANTTDYDVFLAKDSEWYTYDAATKASILRKAAVKIEECRRDLIAVAVEELGKTVTEVDVEVSEAVDFANYYAQSLLDIENKEHIAYHNKGVHLVLSPWNFPIAIPIGGVLASLAAGKRVILKPSLNATACAYLISKTLWESGVPTDAFAFLPTEEQTLDKYLKDEHVFDAVILTGATDTAQLLLKRNPKLKLFAETGGKNATFVSALSDREQAIKNVVQSAFGNSGQKCSATSLLLLEKEVFEDEHFKQLLKDAVESKVLGNPKNLETEIGPLAVKVNTRIKEVLKETPEEKWLLKPRVISDFMMSPGIIWDVNQKDKAFQTELFGPILSVVKVDDISHGISIVNSLKYGLTSGIESLDNDEVTHWTNSIKSGNIYANRTTTGAIVQRQPFGGMKASSFGFGMKAGGANYLLQFLTIIEPLWDIEHIRKDYLKSYEEYFSQKTDVSNIRGQHNYSLYRKPKRIILLIDHTILESQLNSMNLIAEILSIPMEVFAIDNVKISNKVNEISSWNCLSDYLKEDYCIRSLNYDSLPTSFIQRCHELNYHIYGNPISKYGRIEFLNYLTEQSLSINYHRYGNLMGNV